MTSEKKAEASITPPPEAAANRDSHTGVYPSRKHGKGIWNNPRVVMSFRCDQKLKKEFIRFSKRVFGSVCLPLECIMAGLLSTNVKLEDHGVYPSHTQPIKIEVDDIVISRRLRPRRRLEFKGDDVGVCGYRDCDEPIVARGLWKGKTEFVLCREHYREASNDGRIWSDLKLVSQDCSLSDEQMHELEARMKEEQSL